MAQVAQAIPNELKETYQSSVSSNSKQTHHGVVNDEIEQPMHFVGDGEDDAPRSPVRKPHKRNGSLRVNGHKKEGNDHSLLVEKYNTPDGEILTSVKPEAGYEESLRTDEKENKPQTKQDELVSGRRAGAGWDNSG